MPEADYGYKPHADSRQFGQLFAHAANSMYTGLRGAEGRANPNQGTNLEETLKTKAEFVKSINDAYAVLRRRGERAHRRQRRRMVKQGQNEVARGSIVAGLTSHNNEMYGMAPLTCGRRASCRRPPSGPTPRADRAWRSAVSAGLRERPSSYGVSRGRRSRRPFVVCGGLPSLARRGAASGGWASNARDARSLAPRRHRPRPASSARPSPATPTGRSTAAIDNIRYSPLTQINRDNVAQLQVAWTYDSHDAFKASEMQSNPDRRRRRALRDDADAEGGGGRTPRPARRSGSSIRAAARRPARGSGIAASTVHKDRVFVTLSQLPLRARQEDRHSRSRRSATDGRIDLREGLGMPAERAERQREHAGRRLRGPADHGQHACRRRCPGSPGHIRAFDVNTGKLRWIFHTIPQPGEFGYDTWPPDAYKLSGGANAWAGVTVDREARHGVRRHRLGVVRLLRRQPPRRQPVRRLRARARRAHRQARLAFPGHQARRLGLGFPGGAEPRHGDARRPQGRRGRADHEVRLRLRARSHDRRRRCSRSSSARCRRRRSTASSSSRDAAVSGEAAAVRAPGPDRGRC